MAFKSVFVNENEYIHIVSEYAVKYALPVALVMAICACESSFNPYALRYENSINDTSYGLMQILYQTAKICGFKNNPDELFNIDNNLKYGCVYLRDKYNKYNKDLEKTVASYNAGSLKYDSNNDFINRQYINKVISYFVFYNAKFVELNESKTNIIYEYLINKQYNEIIKQYKISNEITVKKSNIIPIVLIAIPIFFKVIKKVI